MNKKANSLLLFISFFVFLQFLGNVAISEEKQDNSNNSHVSEESNDNKSISPLYDEINEDGEYISEQNDWNNYNNANYPTRIFAKFGTFVGAMYYPSNTFFNFGFQLDACFDTKHITPFIGLKLDFATKMGYRKDFDDDLYGYENEKVRKTNDYFTIALRIGNQFIVSRKYKIHISPYIFGGAFIYSQNYKYYCDYNSSYYSRDEYSEVRNVNYTYGAGIDFELHYFLIKLEYRRIGKVIDFGLFKRNVNAVALNIGFTIP